MNTAQKVASELMSIGTIKVQLEKPFVWSSGWRSPIYCDNRLSLSFPRIRSFIKSALAALIKDKFPAVEIIAGVATAGIPQAALLADYLNLPLLYIRTEAKSHGMGKQIEGKLSTKQKVVLVEDLISTGTSAIRAAKVLREAGAEVLGVVAVFSYAFQAATDGFAEVQIPFEVLSDYHELMKLLKNHREISSEEEIILQRWRKSPDTWHD